MLKNVLQELETLKMNKHYNVGKNHPRFGDNKYNITKKFLIKEYIQNKKSITQIAKIIKCCSATIRRQLIKQNIKIRTSKEGIKLLNRKDENHPNYIDGRTNKSCFCIDCSKKVSDYRVKRCKDCHNKYVGFTNMKNGTFKGEKNPSYIDGKGYEPYPQEFNNQLKELIRKRDNYECQKCGIKQKDYYKKLDIHHIDYDKDNLNPKNLITLCHECHMKTNANRDYWYAYFTYLMEEKLIIKETQNEL